MQSRFKNSRFTLCTFELSPIESKHIRSSTRDNILANLERVLYRLMSRIVYKTPDKKDTDLMFAVYQDKKTPNPGHFYDDFCKSFWQDIRPHE